MKNFFLTGALLLASVPMIISATETTVMPGSDRDTHGCIGSAGYSWSESTQKCVRPWEQSGSTNQYATGAIPPAPQTLTGAELEVKALHMAMTQLSPTDRAELMKMIRTYVEWKGIKVPTVDQVQAVKQEIKQDKKETKQERKILQNTAKQKREDMRKRNQERRMNTGNTMTTGTVSQ